MFQQFLAYKHRRLRYSMPGRAEVGPRGQLSGVLPLHIRSQTPIAHSPLPVLVTFKLKRKETASF